MGVPYESPSQYFSCWNKIKPLIDTRLQAWPRDSIPPHYTYREFTPKGEAILPAGIELALDELYQCITSKHSAFRKHYEGKYRRKMNARNVRKGKRTLQQFANIRFNWERTTQLTGAIVEEAINATFPNRRIAKVQPGYFPPPKEQASMGIWVDEEGKPHVGAKGPMWDIAMTQAHNLYREILAMGLTWSSVEGHEMELGRELAKRYQWCFMPAWRLDGGPDKLRMLLIGTITMYIIEHWVWQSVHDDLVTSQHTGYNPRQVMDFFEEGAPDGHKLFSGDFQAYDQNQTPEHLKAVYQGTQRAWELPEALMVVLFLYNCYTPAIITVTSGDDVIAVVKHRNGQAASGIGGFSYANTIGNVGVNYLTTKLLGLRFYPGSYMGDDHVQFIAVGAALWKRRLNVCSGLAMDEADAKAHASEAVYCRRFFVNHQRMSTPIVMSRARNTLFPEHSDPWAMHAFERAVVYRAQGAEILLGKFSTTRLRDAWELIAPGKHYLYEAFPADDDLARAVVALESLGLSETRLDTVVDKLTMSNAWLEDE